MSNILSYEYSPITIELKKYLSSLNIGQLSKIHNELYHSNIQKSKEIYQYEILAYFESLNAQKYNNTNTKDKKAFTLSYELSNIINNIINSIDNHEKKLKFQKSIQDLFSTLENKNHEYHSNIPIACYGKNREINSQKADNQSEKYHGEYSYFTPKNKCLCQKCITGLELANNKAFMCKNPKCDKSFHFECLKINNVINKKIDYINIECPYCVLYKCDPLHQVISVINEPWVITKEKIENVGFVMSSEVLNFINEDITLGIEIRSIKLEENSHEQAWPDEGRLLINKKEIIKFNSLPPKSSLKRRKDKRYFTRDIIKGYNEIQIECFNMSCPEKKSKINEGTYLAGIYLIKKLSVAELVRHTMKYNLRSREICKQKIIEYFTNANQDFQVESAGTSLSCVLSLERLNIPAKGSLCSHLTCFSLENYISVCEKDWERKWNCPICKKRSYDIIVDQYFMDILQEVTKMNYHGEEVIFNRNGSYLLLNSNAPIDSTKNSNKPNMVNDYGKSSPNSAKNESKAMESNDLNMNGSNNIMKYFVKQKVKNQPIEVVEILSEEDEEVHNNKNLGNYGIVESKLPNGKPTSHINEHLAKNLDEYPILPRRFQLSNDDLTVDHQYDEIPISITGDITTTNRHRSDQKVHESLLSTSYNDDDGSLNEFAFKPSEVHTAALNSSNNNNTPPESRYNPDMEPDDLTPSIYLTAQQPITDNNQKQRDNLQNMNGYTSNYTISMESLNNSNQAINDNNFGGVLYSNDSTKYYKKKLYMPHITDFGSINRTEIGYSTIQALQKRSKKIKKQEENQFDKKSKFDIANAHLSDSSLKFKDLQPSGNKVNDPICID